METVFYRILSLGFSASLLVLVTILLRTVFYKGPKWALCLLWIPVAIRLLCPFSIESELSLLPRGINDGLLISELKICAIVQIQLL